MTPSSDVEPAFLLLLLSKTGLPSLAAAALLALAVLWLAPGGLAWALARSRSIPGPPGILLALAGTRAHRALSDAASALGARRLMAFSVGLTKFVVSSDPSTAREILSGPAFADRPIKESAYELLFHRAMGFAPSGDYWRRLRRISAAHLFSPRRVASLGGTRSSIGEEMVRDVERSANEDRAVEVRRVLHFGSLNNVMMSVFGERYDFGSENGVELEGMVGEGYALLGVFNWGDHLPLLGVVDLQGVRKRCRVLVGRVKGFVGRIIEDHRERRRSESIKDGGDDDRAARGGDFVDVLLDLEEDERLSDPDMVAVLWEMIFRGTDTVAILLEWTMARMVLHPDIQAKAQAEIDSVVGGDPHRPITDSEVANLRYLHAVVKETLRMHPPGPLLSWARLATRDVHVGAHLVPAGTTAMVNMWAIAHDGSIWPEPEEFRPERFMEAEVSVLGSDLRLAPFGSGRRVCPGKTMALATVHLWLAQLLQRFSWVPLENGVDLSERLKMSLEMVKPLVCKAIPRS